MSEKITEARQNGGATLQVYNLFSENKIVYINLFLGKTIFFWKRNPKNTFSYPTTRVLGDGWTVSFDPSPQP